MFKFIFLLLFTSLQVFAAGSPFSEGTQTVVLSPEDRAQLLEYADTSKARLEKALDEAAGKSFNEARDVYLKAIKKVVIESYASKPRSELLMRYALNQGLELTFGVPKVDGNGFERRGVLQLSANRDLMMTILEDSIKLAIHYYKDDRKAIESGNLIDLPYVALAQDRLELARYKWLPAVLEWGYQYSFSLTALRQWLATVANEEQQRKAVFAEEITDVDGWIKDEAETKVSNQRVLEKRVRAQRKQLRTIAERMKKKIGEQGGSETRMFQAGVGQSENPPGIKFVSISPGTFMMGSPIGEAGRDSNESQHKVTISKSFEMQTTEVTQLQWFKVLGTTPSSFGKKEYCPNDFDEKNNICPSNPVESVTWDDVGKFIAELNKGLNDGYEYRLPTEAEWEYAARAGTQTAYSFGDNESLLELYAWWSANSGSHTNSVATKKPNAWGLYDVHGNVWEWVSDWYRRDYENLSQVDPENRDSGSARVVRGGGWGSRAQVLRSAYRSGDGPSDRGHGVGFRLARTKK